MCGIVGYIGTKPVDPILVKGLRRLEYRGYDSAGIATLESTNIEGSALLRRIRAIGKVDNLAEKVTQDTTAAGTVGIAHTRWATHGGVTETNSHPHTALGGKLAIVHNGIIENYREIREKLEGITLESETDTEILAHLIGSHYDGDLRAAVAEALSHVHGTYGLVVMHADHPDTLVGARMGSPLVVGVADDGYYIASDAAPLLPYTKRVVYLDDGELVELSRKDMQTYAQNDIVTKHIEEITWSDEEVEKGGFDSFLLKEIHDQPRVLRDALRGRYNLADGTAYLGGLNMTEDEMRSIDRIIIIACGTASYAARAAKYSFERLAGIPVEVDVASEFRYRDPIITPTTLVFGVSQSGETADTIAALREAKRKGAFVRGVVNVIGSTIARETDGGTYIHAGPELSVASSKAYTNMVAVLTLYALQFGRLGRVTNATGQRILKALSELPEKIEQILEQKEMIEAVVAKYVDAKHFFYLGRGVNYPVALEGSLKLKEITYIHSEAYPGGELKHGPLALLDETFPVIAIMTKDQLYDKMRSNVEEIRARKAPVILIATEGDDRAKEVADDVIYVPDTMELLEPMLNTIPLQLFSYYMAVALGRNVDRPRNLAKSVTVE